FLVTPGYIAATRWAVDVPEHLHTVPPGETRELRFDPPIGLIGSAWLLNARITQPGKYTLRAVFAPEMRIDGSFDPASAVASDEQPYTVATPAGEDAAVWEWMQKTVAGPWGESAWNQHAGDFSRYVLSRH